MDWIKTKGMQHSLAKVHIHNSKKKIKRAKPPSTLASCGSKSDDRRQEFCEREFLLFHSIKLPFIHSFITHTCTYSPTYNTSHHSTMNSPNSVQHRAFDEHSRLYVSLSKCASTLPHSFFFNELEQDWFLYLGRTCLEVSLP